ncbi:MAG: flagellar protein FliS [Rickettsiales bacterium]|nr:flagellar protein FliS [Rickettsiales bacterium]
MTYAINNYKNAFQTLDKFSNLFSLYEGAIVSLMQAKDAIINKDVQTRYNKIEKAYLIVSGLRDCLDIENGGEVAETLKDWYTGVCYRILSINSSEDLSMCDMCIRHLKEMKDSWLEAKNTYEKELKEDSKSGANDGFLPDISIYFNPANIGAMQAQPMAFSV